MRREGTTSWRFAEDIGQIPHAALFVRDALRLEAEATAGVPPLAGEVPDMRHVLDPETRARAASQWPSWWAAIVSHQVEMNLGDAGSDRRGWQQRMHERLRSLVDPPGWESLADRPALQAAVRACFDDACRWAGSARQPLLPPRHSALFEREILRIEAENVADERGVDLGELNACVMVLLVTGFWHQIVSPAAALCSLGAAQDPGTAASVLRAVFTSSAGG